jgi:L-ascorbate metabolism protein UlaG (beta-lactamase superfamily)
MKIIYHGHSFLEIELADSSILVDPFIEGNSLCDIDLENIVKKNIKMIFITHGHMDHIWDTPYIVSKTWAKVVSTFEVVQYLLRDHDITNSYPMHIGGIKEFEENIKVKFVNAVHGWGVWPNLLWWKAAWIVLTINNVKIYHAGDTALTYDMKLLEEEKIDIAFLPVSYTHLTLPTIA